MPGVKDDAAVTAGFEFLFEQKTLDLNGRPFVFRELSVKENDACIDAAKKEDGTIDGRTNMRLMIVKSSVNPTISLDQLASFPNRIYYKIAEFVNELNSLDDAESPPDEGTEGNG